MPGKLKVRIVSARNLPVMDRASELTDAFVEVKFGNTILKTEVFKKSLNPQWNSDWFRFEVDDEDLQDEPLQIRVLDHDTYTAHDAIGKIYIDLNPLLNDNKTSTFGGWYPIYDTMHGIQGQLYVVIKLDLFSDLNKFRRSSCGVRFFCTSGVPEGYEIETLLGFVEELTVDDDPEYQWIDKIRSMRASNEARQMRFSKLSSQLQRKIGLKVLEMGGNAVLGYRRCFDLEGESGVVVRAIGTCVSLKRKMVQESSPSGMVNPSNVYFESITNQEPQPTAPTTGNMLSMPNAPGPTCVGAPLSVSPVGLPSLVSNSVPPLPKYLLANRRLSESDAETPGKGLLNQWKTPFHRPMMQQENIEMMEYPFFTMRSYPRGHIKHLGGVVSATSVKLLDKMNDPDEPKTRDLWWTEIRTEIRSHMRALDCNCVLGYSERTSIRDELIVLSAIGTAAILNPSDIVTGLAPFDELGISRKMGSGQMYQQKCRNSSFGTTRKGGAKPERRRLLSDASSLLMTDTEDRNHDAEVKDVLGGDDACEEEEAEDAFSISSSIRDFPQCSICHIPYPERDLPFPVNLCKCRLCQQFRVPDIIFCTIDPPPELPTVGKGCLVQARICRPKKEGKGESNAKEVSDSLPFVEYELHKQLVNKLKVKGMNSLFGLTIQLAIGESQLIAIATATGVYSEPLPSPGPPLIINKNDSTLSDLELQTIRGRLNEAIKKNRAAYKITDQIIARPGGMVMLDNEDVTMNDAKRMNETFVFEIDDTEDAQVVSVLLEPPYPNGFEVCNVERMPGLEGSITCNLQMFTKIWKAPLKSASNTTLDSVIDNIMKSLFFKFRAMRPCTLCRLEFDIDLSTDDELQIIVTGMCSGIGGVADQSTEESGRVSSNTLVSKMSTNRPGGSFEKADHNSEHDSHAPPIESPSTVVNFRMGGVIGDSKNTISSSILSSISLAADNHRAKHHSWKTRPFGIHLTPLSFIPRSTVQSYVGHLNFFIIRESTSVREEGGPSCFMHNFLAEVMAICRAHVRSLGGNALVSFKMMECTLLTNVHKNQSQCLVNVFGDAVNVVYDPDSMTASHLSLELKAANHEANRA